MNIINAQTNGYYYRIKECTLLLHKEMDNITAQRNGYSHYTKKVLSFSP